jgi:hypothetical protein
MAGERKCPEAGDTINDWFVLYTASPVEDAVNVGIIQNGIVKNLSWPLKDIYQVRDHVWRTKQKSAR